ncbi:MAG: uroporphyrinogen decarboxylase [Planctomycetota bacterium]|jgi:uroporphyrinogen decarboxylase|nr:uroporphyrinogen decarboxylase [Planctomycetota bacterium]
MSEDSTQKPVSPAPLGASLGPSFGGLRVAALESRRRDDFARLIERFGGVPFVSPSMREVPIDKNKEAIEFAYRVMTAEIGAVIFLTGVGFKQLIAAIEPHVDKQRFLDSLSDIPTVARGPKPVAAMREFGLKPTHRAPEPNTWREVLQTIDIHVPISNVEVGLQEYGITNHSLIAGLEARGAKVTTVKVYQWELPEDIQPLIDNVQAIVRGERDCLLFTSAHQAVNLLRIAQQLDCEAALRLALRSMVVASIGPTTSEMLQHLEIPIDVEPEHSKMGHLVQASAEKSPRILKAKRFTGITGLPIGVSRNDLSNKDKQTSGTTMNPYHDNPFMKACFRQESDVTPVWLMRQAGRYMAEYRAVREKVSFLELCKNPKLCAEVMVTAVEKLGVDAAIIFSDLLPILEPMGFHLEFTAGDGPVIHNPIRTAKDVDRVKALESMEPLQFVADTVTATRASLPERIPVIGFSGSPFTLASYMIEGSGSRNYVHTKTLMYSDPAAWKVLMDKLVESIALYLNSQIAAGAQCVQLFDSWAGCLSPNEYRTRILPHMHQLLESIVPGVPVVNFATGNPMLTSLLRGDSRTVVGLDWRVPLDVGWDMAGNDRAVQGNLDPTVLFSDLGTIRDQVHYVLSQAAGRPGHIFNLGHGILPGTPVDNVIALVDMVHELSDRRK